MDYVASTPEQLGQILKNCRKQLKLTMPLLADFNPKGEVTKAYGAWIEQVGHGNRSLVLIEDGEVRWSYASPTPLEIPGANLIFDALAA